MTIKERIDELELMKTELEWRFAVIEARQKRQRDEYYELESQYKDLLDEYVGVCQDLEENYSVLEGRICYGL